MDDRFQEHQLDLRYGLSETEVRQLNDLHGSMDFREGDLHFGGLNLRQFQTRQTAPSLIYDPSRVAANLDAMDDAWRRVGHTPRIFFAMKCCYLRGVLSAVRDAGHGVEVMSDLELQMALQAGFAPQDIVIGGTAKSRVYLERAASLAPALIVIDSVEDATGLVQAAQTAGRTLNAALRVLPSDPRAVSAFILPDGKLGMAANSDDMAQAIRILGGSSRIEVTGIHAHVVTHCQDPEHYGLIVDALVEDILFLQSRFEWCPDIVNLGGGLDTRFLLARNGTCAADFAAAAARALAPLGRDVQVFLEPGRFVAADSAVGLGRIVGRKQQGNRRWLISDLSSNVLIPLPDIGYAPVPLNLPPMGNIWRNVDIADATCAPSHICRHCPLPDLQIGDSLAFANCGAYTSVFSELWAFALPNIWMLTAEDQPHQVFGPDNQKVMYRALYDTDVQLGACPRPEVIL